MRYQDTNSASRAFLRTWIFLCFGGGLVLSSFAQENFTENVPSYQEDSADEQLVQSEKKEEPQEEESIGERNALYEKWPRAEEIFISQERFEDRFSPFFLRIFRFFAIAVGSFPLSYLASSLVYDWSVYFLRRQDSRYYPIPSFTWAALNLDEREQSRRAMDIFWSSLSTSLIFSVVDALLVSWRTPDGK